MLHAHCASKLIKKLASIIALQLKINNLEIVHYTHQKKKKRKEKRNRKKFPTCKIQKVESKSDGDSSLSNNPIVSVLSTTF